jgi:ketosteroid isomerase-like protein
MAGDAKSLGLAFLQSFWDGDPERGYRLCAPDAKWRFQKSLHTTQEVPVRVAVEHLNNTLIQGFDPNLGYTVDVHNSIGEGDEAAIEYSAKGTTKRGAVYHNNYLVRFTTRNGQIVSIRPYFDTHYVHRQLFALD